MSVIGAFESPPGDDDAHVLAWWEDLCARLEELTTPTSDMRDAYEAGKTHCGGDRCDVDAYSEDACECRCDRCGPWNDHRDAWERKDEREADAARWASLALLVGYNELARNAKTLGERVYFRLCRGEAEEDYVARGGRIEILRQADDEVVLEIPTGEEVIEATVTEAMPRVAFQARDVELMRACVAEHDRRATDLVAAAVDEESDHCGRDPSVVGACGGTDATCSCECAICEDPR